MAAMVHYQVAATATVLGTALLVAGSLITLAYAQETTSQNKGISSQQDATTVSLRITQLQAQLAAVEKETLRRLQCQADTKVSTATGCAEVPGLRERAQQLLTSPTAH